MSERTKIDIALLLPTIPDARDACVLRLRNLLRAKEGIETAHLLSGSDTRAAQICIHFDPARFSVGEVRDLARRAGLELEQQFGHLLLKAEPMHARQARTVELRASQIAGVLDAAAAPTGVLRIEFDFNLTTEEALLAGVQKLGLRIIEVQKHRTLAEPTEVTSKPIGKERERKPGGLLGERTELYFAVLCGGFLVVAWLLSTFSHLPSWIPLSLYVVAYFFGGSYTFREAFQSIRSGRFEIDFLMLVAATGAASLGEWAEGALLLFLFSLGHALEHYAMGRAKRAIESLAELAPETALVRRFGNTEEVPVAELRPGDVVIVKPNERIAADGFVIHGEGSVNQAPITGESVPVDKMPVENLQEAAANPDRLAPQYRAFAGTINGSGALQIQVTKLASDSTLARVVQMVSEAETQKSPTQRFADKFERYFVPAVLACVVLLLFAWAVIDESFSTSFYRAMAVLVAAGPCALAISPPGGVLSGVARAARGG
ncbi:MAG TPA: HAD-IC family P-type ATPase, partial [Pirellulaceae bacterium]|nr:HAD-IC family P-type ATPase [Pirellulaceae bacterium]